MTLGQGLINILFGQISQLPSNFIVRPYHVTLAKLRHPTRCSKKYRDFIVATKNIGIYKAFCVKM